MKTIVATTSAVSVGATFVDWSIHFLSGQKTFYNVDQQSWISVNPTPLTDLNSHGHQKNHPSGFKNSKAQIDCFKETPGSLFTFYPFPLHLDDITSDLNNLTSNQWQAIIDKQCSDYNQLFSYCNQESVKLIYISLDPVLSLYNLTSRSLERMPFSNSKPTTINDIQEQLDQTFFSKSIHVWKDLNLVNRWDLRERLALCNRPFADQEEAVRRLVDFSQPHLWIDSRNLWYNGKETMHDIFDYTRLTIDANRLSQWQIIYSNWQKKQLKRLEFTYNYQHIIDSIINNWFYPIDLSFEEEVVIQHCLIYRYGLNLKTWNLEKFPSNTQDLHKLLESNIHPIESIY